jgi:hypothetical protein
MIEGLDVVELTRDLPKERLANGDVGTAVGGAGYEFTTPSGDTVAVVPLDASDVRPVEGTRDRPRASGRLSLQNRLTHRLATFSNAGGTGVILWEFGDPTSVGRVSAPSSSVGGRRCLRELMLGFHSVAVFKVWGWPAGWWKGTASRVHGGRIGRPSILQGNQISSETIRSYRRRCKIDVSEIRYLGQQRLFYHSTIPHRKYLILNVF